MKTFSERKGLKPISKIIQIDSMTTELRNSLWNALDIAFWSKPDFVHGAYGPPQINDFSWLLWSDYFKKPVDTRPYGGDAILTIIREYFFSCEWNEVYDFLEFIVSEHEDSRPRLADFLNGLLERELSGYRFVSGHLHRCHKPRRNQDDRRGSKRLQISWRLGSHRVCAGALFGS